MMMLCWSSAVSYPHLDVYKRQEDIFRRIHKFCSINHIRLYGINGDNLFDRFRFESELDEDIIYTFEKSFSRCKNKRIVLYGKGPRTGLIVEAFPQYNIVGIMDKKIKEGYCYGKRILSIEGVLENKVDIITVSYTHLLMHLLVLIICVNWR